MKRVFAPLFAALVLIASPAAVADSGDAGASLWPRLDFEWYGYLKVDVAYDGSRTAPGEYAKWVMPEDRGADESVEVTANQTRLGLRVEGPWDAAVRARARVEIDFFGEVEDPDPRIRHAYFEVAWPESGLGLLVGQTADVISPLNPSTLNYTVAWFAGNIGFRRPQVRVTKRFETPDGRHMLLEGALTRNVYDTSVDGVTAEDSGFPGTQVRAALAFPRRGREPAMLGFSGHRAEEEFADGRRCESWSANLDLRLPLRRALTLQGELFAGESLAPYLGGVGQGIVLEDLHGVRSRGGWVDLALAPADSPARFHFGWSVDDPEGRDLAAGARERNRSLWGNVVYSLGEDVDVGLELSHWNTSYKDGEDRDTLRTQMSFIYKL